MSSKIRNFRILKNLSKTIFFKFLFKDALSLLITENVVDWAKNSLINNESLIREMFALIFRQYNSLGEVIFK